MKSIVFVCPSLSLGGAERHLVRYIKGLVKRKYVVSVVVIGSGAALAAELPVEVKITFFNRRFLDPRAAVALWMFLGRMQPDTVFGWSNLASFLVCMTAPRSSRLIACELSYPPFTYRENGYPVYLAYRAMTLLYSRADMVVANSEPALDALKAWVGKKPRYLRIFNPIEFDEIEKQSVLGHEQPSMGEGVRIVAVGRLYNRHKGFDILVSALAKLSWRLDWSCVIVGGGADRHALEAQIAEVRLCGRILLAGPQTNPFSFMRTADIFVMPSRVEGFPNVLLEAMALGKAVIAADCLAGPREITEEGRCGLLFPVNDAEGLAREIVRLLDQPGLRRELGDAAVRRVRTAWSESAVFLRLVEVIECPRTI